MKLDSWLEGQLRDLEIWYKVKKQLDKDPDFRDVVSTSFDAVNRIVGARKDSKLIISCRREPYMWALLYVVECDCSHKSSMELWRELSDTILQSLEYSEKRLLQYLRLVRLEVRSREELSWEG